MKLSLYFDITPMAVQSVRFANMGSFIQKYQPKKNTEYKGCIKALAMNQMPMNWIVTDKPVKILKAYYVFPTLKSMPKKLVKQIEEGAIYYKQSKPDLMDNLNKATLDALTGVIWRDDSQIVHSSDSYKIYGLRPGIELEIEVLENCLSY